MANYQSTHTGQQIDEAVDKVLPLVSTAEQIDDTVNRTATYSNRNIVDNPFFTVRQRSVVDENGYFFDRWKRQQSVITMSDNGDGITLTTTATGSSVVSQFLENNIPQGTTVSLSVEFSQTAGSANGAVRLASNRSGTVISGSSISLGTGVATHKFLSLTIALPTDCAAVDIRVPQGGTLTVHAIKLEYGSVSTLAADQAPDYATELLKCQRYCLVQKLVRPIVAIGGNNFFVLNIPCKLRSKTTSGTSVQMLTAPSWLRCNGIQYESNVASFYVFSKDDDTYATLQVNVNGTPYTNIIASTAYLSGIQVLLSADL